MADNHTRIIVSAKDEASKVFQRAGMEAEGLSKRVSHLSGVMGGLAAFGGVSGLGFGIDSAVDKFGEYETALTDMSKVTERDIDSMRNKIESINPTLGTSINLTKGLYQSISAGVTDPVKAMDLLTVSAKDAQSAHISQSEVVKALTKTMTGFGDEIQNATQASDLLFAMERQGQTSFQELVPVIGDVANLSHEASVSTSALGGAMALLTQTSGSTAEAATKYKALLIGMVKPTKDMGEAFEALGYKSGNALIKDKGLVESLRLLKEYSDKSGVSLTSLFGSAEAFMGVSALLSEDGKKLAENIEAIGAAAGSSEAAYERWSKTVEASKQRFSNLAQNIFVTFGESFAPKYMEGLDSISDWAIDHGDDIKDWAKSTSEAVASASETIATEFSILKSGYDSLPEWMQSAGLLGAFLFGKKGMVMLSAATHLAGAFSNMGQGYEAYANGELSFSDFSSMNSGELSDFLKNRNPLDSLNAELKALESKQAGYIYQDEKDSFNSEIAEIKKRIVEEYSKAAQKIDYSGDAAALARASGFALNNTASGSVVSSSKTTSSAGSVGKAKKDKNALWLDDKDLAKRRTSGSKKRSDAWAKRSGRDMTSELKQFEKAEQKKLEIVKDFNEEYKKQTLGTYGFERTQIEAQADAWIKAGADEVQVANWKTTSLKKLEKEHTEDLKAENKKRIADAKKQAREELLARNDFFEGMKAGFKDVLEAEKNWAERGIDVANSFSTSAKSAFSDFGLDAMTGKMKTFSSYWDTFWGGLARSISNHLADMAVNKGLDMLMSMGGGLFDMAGTFMSNIFHTGNIRVGADEVAAILQTKEMVVPAKQSEEIRQAMGSDGISKGQFFDNVVDYVHAGKQQSYADRFNNYQRDAYGWDMLSVARDSALAGGYNAVQNYMTIGRQAAVLRDQGLNVSQSAVSNAQNSYALSGLVGSFFPSFAGNLVGAWGSRALGLDDNAFSIAGLDISSSNIGNLLGSVAGMFLGGPAASIVSGVLSPVFSLGVSALADAFDMREYETIRDKLEKDLGFIGGRIAYSNFKDAFAPSTIDPGSYNWGFSLQAFTQDQIAQMMIDKMKAISDIGDMPNSVAKTLSKAHMLGNAYTSQMMESKDPAKQTEIAGAIKSDLGFFGYTAREFAAKTLGVGFEFGENYYTADGRKVDIESVENPSSQAYAAWEASKNYGKASNYDTGDNIGGSGYDWSGNGGSWSADRDTGGAGSHDTGGMGNSDYGGKSGYGGTSGSDGYTGGRRFGGPVNAGGSYVWNEEGREILIPKTDGYVLSHGDTRQLMSGLQSIANAQKTGTGPVSAVPSGSSSTIVVNLHVDGQQLASAVVPGLRELSKHGVQMIRADALIGGSL